MSERPLHILAVVASPGQNPNSATRVVIRHLAEALEKQHCVVDIMDLGISPLQLFNPETTYQAAYYQTVKQRGEQADVFLLGTPDYHGSMSGTLKNFFDHYWKEFAGKLFAPVVASHEKGLTVTDQIRTVARQCYAWSMPYGVSFADKEDVKEGQVVNEAFAQRLAMYTRDIQTYGRLLAKQRAADMAGSEPGFLARHRK